MRGLTEDGARESGRGILLMCVIFDVTKYKLWMQTATTAAVWYLVSTSCLLAVALGNGL